MTKNKIDYVTCTQAAKIVGFTSDHLRRLLQTGKVDGEKIGGIWIINRKSLAKVKRLRFPRQQKD